MDKLKISNANALFGHLFFIVLFVFAAVFYRERLVFSDPAFFSFNVIWKESFDIALSRWGGGINQILPILAVVLKLPLKLVLQSYSINFVLSFYLLFLGLNAYLKKNNFLLPFALALVLTFRLTFFYPTAELYLGAFFSLFLIPILWNRDFEPRAISWKTYLLVLLLSIALSYFHQLTLFPLLFILGLSLKGKADFMQKIGLFAVALCWFVLRVKVFSSSSYESDKLLTGDEALFALKNFAHVSSDYHFRDIVFPWLQWFLLLPIIASAIFIKQKRYFPAAATLVGPLVFWMVVIVVLHKGESRIMLDNYYSLGGFFLCMPFAFIDFKPLKINALKLGVVSFLSILSFYGIYRAHFEISKRHVQTQNILDYMEAQDITRGIVADNALDYRIYFQNWALPFEAIYQNALNGSPITRSFFPSKNIAADYQLTQDDPNTFLGPGFAPGWFKNQQMLHPSYFTMPNEPYTIMATSQDAISQPDSIWLDLKLSITKSAEMLVQDRRKMLRLGIYNFHFRYTGETLIPSIPGDTIKWKWAYYFIDGNGTRLEDINYANFLLDLPAKQSYRQAFYINRRILEENDVAAMRVDVFSENYGFLGLNLDYPISQ